MTVGRICAREVYLADPRESVAEAARRMALRNVGELLVLDERRRPAGVLTDRDLAVRVVARSLDPERTVVEEAMTPRPRTLREDTPIEIALRFMRQSGCRRMPVVDSEGALVGLLSLEDILELLGEEMDEIRALAARRYGQ